MKRTTSTPATATAPTVLLEQADLDDGVFGIYRDYGDRVRAAFDPSHISEGNFKVILQQEFARHGRPLQAVFSVGGSLILETRPQGDPVDLEPRPDGMVRMSLDERQLPLADAMRLLRQARAEKQKARA